MNEQRYPLFWPTGWARTPQFKRRESRFQRPVRYAARFHSMHEATALISAELERLGASGAILSTNVEVRLDGTPYSGRRAPEDAGAAVYFTLKGKRLVLACDKFTRTECNVWAIAKHVEAIRAQDRYGVGSIEQAFAGYYALPAPTNGKWNEVLGVAENALPADIESAFRLKAKQFHPDVPGGSSERMQEINAAFQSAKIARGI